MTDGRDAPPRRRGRAASASARTTRTACWRSAGCCGLPARYVSGPRARRGRHARLGGGARAASRRTRTRCAPCRSTRRTTAAPACATSPSPSAATTATCRRPRAPSTRPTPGVLTTHKRAAVTRVEYLRPRRRAPAGAGQDGLSRRHQRPAGGGRRARAARRARPRRRSPGSRRRRSQSSNAPGHGPPTSSTIGQVGRAAERLDDGRRHVAAREQQLERAVDVDHERRPQPLDERHQRLRLGLGAGVLARRGAIRAVLEHPHARARSRADT